MTRLFCLWYLRDHRRRHRLCGDCPYRLLGLVEGHGTDNLQPGFRARPNTRRFGALPTGIWP
jgi:hypothetical protein